MTEKTHNKPKKYSQIKLEVIAFINLEKNEAR